MNPHASSKCAVRLFSSLVAVSALLLAIGCNSNNKLTINNEGFSNSNLTGTYVFSSTGVDSNGYFLAVAGAFTANGSTSSGGITGGMIDVNGIEVSPSSTTITGGSYSVGADGRGRVNLSTPNSTLENSITLDFVLTSSSHGLITEFDGTGTGSGTLDLQNLGSLTGSYSFGLSGATSADTSIAMVGSFDSGSGSGITDINAGGSIPGGTAGLGLTATVTAGTPGTATLASTAGTYTFDVYMVDATHLKFIETDASQIMAGDAFTQQASLPQGVYAYTMEGLDANSTQEPMALAGFFTSDGSSAISAGLEDYNDGGTLGGTMPAVQGFGGSFTPFSGGRTALTLNSIYNGASGILNNVIFAAYPSSGGIQLLQISLSSTSGGAITGGTAFSQGSTPTLAAQGYGLNLTAYNENGEEDDIAQIVLNSSNAFNGNEDANGQGSTTSQSFNGALTPSSAAPGYGSAATTTGNDLGNFNYYVANNGATTLILETDDDQLGVGSFESQNSAQSPGADVKAISHFSPIHVKPSAKGAAKKSKK